MSSGGVSRPRAALWPSPEADAHTSLRSLNWPADAKTEGTEAIRPSCDPRRYHALMIWTRASARAVRRLRPIRRVMPYSVAFGFQAWVQAGGVVAGLAGANAGGKIVAACIAALFVQQAVCSALARAGCAALMLGGCRPTVAMR